MSESDPGHIPAEPATGRRRGRVLVILAAVLAVIALALAFLPVGSFVAGLPALAAVVLGIVAVALGARRLLPAVASFVAIVALVVAAAVSIGQFSAAVGRFAETIPELDDLPTPAPTVPPEDGDGRQGDGEDGALSPGRHRIVYEVLGGGTARISYSAFLGADSGTSSEDDVEVPHRRTQRVTVESGGAPARFTMIASRTSPSDEALGCRISIDGRVVTERRPSGTGAAVPIAVCAADATR